MFDVKLFNPRLRRPSDTTEVYLPGPRGPYPRPEWAVPRKPTHTCPGTSVEDSHSRSTFNQKNS